MSPLEPAPRIQSFVLGDFQTNCHLVTVPEHPGSWIVDCGYRPERLLAAAALGPTRPEAILLTHCHCDHIGGLDAALRQVGPLPVLAHEAEQGFCGDPQLNLSAFMGIPLAASEPTAWLRDGDELALGPTRWRVVHLPGHSPGCVAFVHEPSRQAIVGDTLFAGSIGRTDFPTSDPAAMRRSLARMLEWPDDMRIHPGHGPATTIGQERGSNPFLQ